MSNMLITNYDTGKVFIGDNRFQKVQYTNSTGSTVNLTVGRLMGRVSTSQKALPHVSTATDGSEYPKFICADDYEVADGTTITITVCTGGDVAAEKVTYGGSDTLSTVIKHTYTDSGSATVQIGMSSIRDHIADLGINLVAGTELTGIDNQ